MFRALVLIVLLGATALAQGQTQNVEVEPVTCWWRTAAAAVRVGEPFTLVLTCSILETDAARAIVDRGRLGTAAVQFAPYEVIGGTQGADEVTAGRRFIQHEYSLRLIGEDVFGRDVPIPEMPITYRIESQVQQDASVQGREQTYVLPALPMRVQSLVAADATHIRETPVPSLAAIGAREFRGRLLRLVAGLLFTVSGLMVLVAFARSLRARRRARPAAEQRLLSDAAILAAARTELKSVQHQTERAGWTTSAATRALAAARIVASYAAGRPVAQRVAGDRPPADGELVAGGGLFASAPVVVSGSATPASVDAELAGALAHFTSARYGRTEKLDAGVLDGALAAAIRASNRLGAEHTWVARTRRSVVRTVAGWRQRVWAR
jgi:hypothetical protein